jgi:SAM-dependent methyltransferase
MPNEYTKSWQNYFLRESSPAGPRPDKTGRQIEFLHEHLPLPDFRQVLDVACGNGRHVGPLAHLGYEVVGIDRDSDLVSEAQRLHPTARFLGMDMRDLDHLQEEFDAVICLWQSFGYFDEETNLEVLGKMADRLRLGGRMILDLYNRRYFKAVEWNGRTQSWDLGRWTFSKELFYIDGRLSVKFAWASGESDHFDWQLYAPDEMKALGESVGMKELLTCAEWNENQVAGNRRRMYQIVFEKWGG